MSIARIRINAGKRFTDKVLFGNQIVLIGGYDGDLCKFADRQVFGYEDVSVDFGRIGLAAGYAGGFHQDA